MDNLYGISLYIVLSTSCSSERKRSVAPSASGACPLRVFPQRGNKGSVVTFKPQRARRHLPLWGLRTLNAPIGDIIGQMSADSLIIIFQKFLNFIDRSL